MTVNLKGCRQIIYMRKTDFDLLWGETQTKIGKMVLCNSALCTANIILETVI